jgi:hypothetical protein
MSAIERDRGDSEMKSLTASSVLVSRVDSFSEFEAPRRDVHRIYRKPVGM